MIVKTEKTETSILLDIYERLGVIEQQMRWLTKANDRMEEELAELRDLKSRLGAYVWIGGAVVSGVVLFLAQGLKYVFDKWMH